MRKKFSALLFLLAANQFLFAQDEKVIARNPEVITGQLIKVTGPLRDFKTPPGWVDVPVRDENGRIWPGGIRPAPFEPVVYPEQQQNEDPAVQKNYNITPNNAAARAIGVNFNGMGYTSVNPPDPTMCAGPNHIIQMINGNSGAYFKVYNKSGGQVVAQTFLDQVTGRGGLGDPIALYDHIADRFVLLEFANKPENANTEGLIIAVSQTSDPSGSWYVYFFGFGNTFPDYPKMSVWNDAYYCTTNDFANATTYTGSSVWAFNRAQMIAGNVTAQSQRFTLGSTSKYFSMCPVLLQGSSNPPAGTGGLIAYMQDDAWTSSTSDVDSIGLLEFDVNFTTPSATAITHKSSLAASAFKSNICTATRGRCISQPGSAVALEALHQKVMNQPVYRNFAGYEGIVLTHVVDKGSSISGVRWYELKKTTGNWSINQQSTYTPDNTHRWMPGICYDKFGNIGLAYNVSSSATGVFPGVRYTGRRECDPLNTLTYSEDVIVAGTAANGSTRYGDYNHLVADPDGVTFWFTAEWNGASTWSTRIASFTLDQCTPVVCGDPSGLASSSVTTNSATISWTAVSGALSYDVDYKPASSSTWTNAATGTTSTSVNLSGLSASTLYDWRVRANCSGGSGNYVTAQFTTQTPPPVCATPTGLASSSITSTSATVSWTAVSGALSYDVDYKPASSSTWTNAATGTTSTSVNLSGLSASTLYDWRVRANCSGGSGNYAQAQFTTSAPPTTCPSSYDNVANGAFSNSQLIPLNTDIKGRISPSGDNDYYRFVISTGGTVTITLTTLPADYDIRIYNSAQSQIAISQNGGTTSETLNLTLAAGTYYARVYGWAGANNATVCYTLRVATGTASAPELLTQTDKSKQLIEVFPNPASNIININITGFDGVSELNLFDINGRLVIQKTVNTINSQMDISKLPSGVYMMRVRNGENEVRAVKIVKQ